MIAVLILFGVATAAISTWRTLGGALVGVAMFGLMFVLAIALGSARSGGSR